MKAGWSHHLKRVVVVLESTAKRANLAYSRFYQLPEAGRPRIKNPYQFSTLEISEPAVAHLKLSEDENTGYVHVKGLPRLSFKIDGSLPTDRQPRAIRITRTARRLNIALIFNTPTPAWAVPATESVGIDPGVKHLLTTVDDQEKVLQVPAETTRTTAR